METIREIAPGDVPSLSHPGQQDQLETVHGVILPVLVPQSSIPGQQPVIDAANNIHDFDYPGSCMPVDSIQTMSSNVSQNLKTKVISSLKKGSCSLNNS